MRRGRAAGRTPRRPTRRKSKWPDATRSTPSIPDFRRTPSARPLLTSLCRSRHDLGPTREVLMYADGWYVCASSEEVGRSLIARRILGEPVVIYRTEDGAPVMLEDRCAHRRLPLSKGRLIGDRVQCGYHGLEF